MQEESEAVVAQQPQPQEIDPYDTSADEQELQALQLELEQNSASIEADFAKYVAENMTPEQEVLMLDNKEAFIKDVLLPMQNQFYQDKIVSKQNRAKELENGVNQKRNRKAYDSSVNEFLSNSKMNQEQFNAMMDFYQEEVSPRMKRELEQLPPNEFFKKLYHLFSGEDKNKPQEKLPQQISGVANSALYEDTENENNPMDRI